MPFVGRMRGLLVRVLALVVVISNSEARAVSAATTAGVGVNVAPVETGGIAFVDAMKQAAPWSAAGGGLHLDALGNVVALRPGQEADTVIYPTGAYRSGRYTLLYDGTGTFAVAPQSGTIVAHAAGRLVISVAAKAGSGIHLRLLATDPRNYARNVRLLMPGSAPGYDAAPFDPAFVASLRGLGTIRFAGWQRPDPVAGRSWASRTTPGSFTQAGPQGVAPEYAIALANAARANPWFTLPVDASDDYITKFSQLVARELDPSLHPSFEFGDEVWLAGTRANTYAALAGRRLGLAPDASNAALAWYSLRSTQMFALVDRSFAAGAELPGHILSGPVARPGTPAARIASAILRFSSAGTRADVYAVSGDAATSATSDSLANGFLGSAFAGSAALANGTHLRLVAYRGGNGGELTSSLLGLWRASGGGMFVSDALTANSPRTAANALAAAAAYSRLTVGALADVDTLARTLPGRAVGVPLAADATVGATLLSESFAQAETPARAWLASGDSCLTAGAATTSVLSIHPCNGSADHATPGKGALQLTATAPNRRAFAVYRTPLDTARGLAITFTDYTFGGPASADGVNLFLADAAALMPTAAAANGFAPASAFVTIGIGQALTVRGATAAGSPALGGSVAADGTAANLPFALGMPQLRERPLRAPTVRAIVTPSGSLTVALDRHDGHGYVAYYQRQIAQVPGQTRLPASVYLGFTAATTKAAARRQIAELRVATLQPATSFSPTVLHNLVSWYDATSTASLTKSTAGAVTAWKDQTGYNDTLVVPATHAAPTYSNGINGLGTISFDGTTLLAGSNQAFSSNLFNESTVFVVGDETPTTLSGDILFSGAYHAVSPTYAIRPTSFSSSYFAFNTESGALTASKVESGATIWTTAGSVSNASRFFRRNGGTIATGGAPAIKAAGSYPLAVGSMYSGGTAASYNYRGQVGEIVIYNRFLTPAEYTEVEGYLACKWGLQSRLAAGHPYRTVCPGGGTGPTPAPTSTPSGVTLPDPVQLRSSNGQLTVNVTATTNPANGYPAISYNGVDTPPTLRLLPGDTLVVNLSNKLPVPAAGSTYANDVNLHYHGLHVSPNVPADDSIDVVATPGKSVQYKIPIPANHPPGLYWYHSHAHAEAERENLAGMSGAIVIEGITKYTPAVTNLPERIIIVRDAQPPGIPLPPGDLSQLEAMRWGAARVTAGRTSSMAGMSMGMKPSDEVRGSTNAETRNPYLETNPFYRAFVRPDAADTHCTGAETPNKVWTVNGVTQPSIGIKPGEKQFWRVVNAGADTYLDLAIDGASMQIISLDGVPLITGTNTPASMTVNHYVIPPSSRIEFIVTGPASGTKAYVRTNCFDAGPSGLAMPAAILASIDPTTSATAASRTMQRSSPQAKPFRFHTADYIKAHAANVAQTIYFSEQLQINGQSYNPTGPPMFYAQVGTTQDWTIVNTSTQVHTFHMHQIHFIVEEINGVTQAQQFVMDNVNVPSATSSGPGTVKIRLDFTDPLIVGTFLVHCHILSHEDSGMMAKIRVGTAPPLVVNPASLTFATPTAGAQQVTISGGKAPFSPSGCTGVAKASITGTTLTVAPAGAGGCLLTVDDATGLAASISVTVSAVKSPVSLSSTSVSFATSKATAQTVEIGGGTLPYTAAGCADIATTNVNGQVLTITPVNVGTCTITVSDAKNNTASLSVTVNSPTTGGNAADNLTFHQDALRSGWNQHETVLTTANVASANFAKLTSLVAPAGSPAFGKVYAQPLYVTNEATSDGNTHNLVVVATSTDQVYAFDDKTYQVVWHRSFLGAGVTQQSWSDTGCYSPGPDVGITGTPVIDRGLDRIYAVVATKENGTFHLRIHAISLKSGAEAVNPTDITGTVTMSTGGTASVDPLWNLQRPALLESAGNIYVALGSKCDWKDNFVHGWLLAYSASSLRMTGNMLDTSNANDGSGTYLGSIWSAYGPAADPQGYVYFATGNGPYDGGVNNFGMSVVKIAGTLSHANVSYFSPYLESADSKADGDLGSGGIMLLPDQTGPYTHMIVAGGKCGAGAANGGTTGCQKYILNRDNLGGRKANEAGALWHGNTAGWMWGGPAYFQDAAGTSHVIYGGGGESGNWAPLSTYNLNKSPVSLSIQSSQSAVPCMICTRGNPGGSIPIVTSNGKTANTAIVWAIQSPGQNGGNMSIYAFNALNMSSKLFSGVAGNWTVPPGAAQVPGPFVSPMVANGKVYVPVDGAVGVFGLKNAANAVTNGVAQTAREAIEGASRTRSSGHVIYGSIVRIAGNTLTVALRGGRSLQVDATAAIAAHTYAAPLYLGKSVTITGEYGTDGTLRATTISNSGGTATSEPADR